MKRKVLKRVLALCTIMMMTFSGCGNSAIDSAIQSAESQKSVEASESKASESSVDVSECGS